MSPSRQLSEKSAAAGRCEIRTERQIGPVMKLRQIVAAGLAAVLAGIPIVAQQAPPTATISGMAKKEAKKPYTDYTTRARDVQTGVIAGTATNGDPDANFTIGNLPPANYVVELLNKDGKIVCTEGPFDMTKTFVRNDVDISCNKVPAAWWLLGVAAAAGITAGVVVATQSSTE
jgi:hypothetical protein